jgi:hypothetical protein
MDTGLTKTKTASANGGLSGRRLEIVVPRHSICTFGSRPLQRDRSAEPLA